MKRRRNPDVPTPVIVLASVAAGGALAWWLLRPTTPALSAPTVAPNRYLTGEESNALVAQAEAAAGRRLSREETAALLAATGRVAPLIENREGVILPTPEEQRAAELYDAQFRAGATPVGPGANGILNAVFAGGRTPAAETAAALERIRSGASRDYIA